MVAEILQFLGLLRTWEVQLGGPAQHPRGRLNHPHADFIGGWWQKTQSHWQGVRVPQTF